MGKALNNLIVTMLLAGGGMAFLFTLCDNEACRTLQQGIQGSAPHIADDGTVFTTSALLADLVHQGTISETWTMDDPPMGIRGNTTIVEGAFVLLFEYASEDEAKADAASLANAGRTAYGERIHWSDDAHFFQKHSLVAVYIGKNSVVLQVLTEALGAEVR